MKRMVVVSILQGGLSNCMKSFISALRHDLTAKTCSRHLLLILNPCHIYKQEPVHKVVDEWRFEIFPEDIEVTSELTALGEKSAGWNGTPGFRAIDCGYSLIPQNVTQRINKVIKSIKWSDGFIKYWNHVLQYIALENTKCIGIHIRSWKHSTWDQTIGIDQNCASRHFDIEDYVNELKKIDNLESYTLFIASDHVDHIHVLQERFQNIQFLFQKGNLADPSIVALTDCLLLSKCDTIIGKYDSTFTELAWYFGEQKAKVILV